jgi:putative protease
MKPELMSPCADWVSLRAAVEAGADAVYFGAKGLNMRAAAKNFEHSELGKVAAYCHENGVKAYLTVNTIIYDRELEAMDTIVASAKDAGIDAIICWDIAVISSCLRHGIAFIVSIASSSLS